MIDITPPKSRVIFNLEKVEEPIKRIENRMIANVYDLNESYNILWSLPDEEIEEIVNTRGIAWFQSLLEQHAANATMFNNILASRDITDPTAVIGLPRQFTIENGIFHLVPKIIETTETEQ